MKKLTKEIPINCKICEYCIEDYDTGKLICNFDESNTELLTLGVCGEFEIGKIRLVEFLEGMEKKIETLESENKLLKKIIKEKIEYAIELNEILIDLEDYNDLADTYIKKQKNWD